MSALSPTTRVVLDAMCDGNAQTLAVMRHACIEVREVLASLQSRLAASEAEAERARGLLEECRNRIDGISPAPNSLAARIDAHLASRPEGEVRHG